LRKLQTIVKRLLREHPELDDSGAMLLENQVTIDGVLVKNPRTLVRPEARVHLARPTLLRGSVKLGAALEAFAVDARERVTLDLGASTGGFTAALLASGARRVYAVDVGHGQLLGSLRRDARVVGELDERRVPELVQLMPMDLSSLPVASAIGQLGRVRLCARAELVTLMKPMFELRRAETPREHESLGEALELAAAAVERHGWRVLSSLASPVPGAHGARGPAARPARRHMSERQRANGSVRLVSGPSSADGDAIASSRRASGSTDLLTVHF
jgi:23S rRNA (cytidine1920-2'-O)/16S rRNA (cytidine1409-2'-O)-methyltransferase